MKSRIGETVIHRWDGLKRKLKVVDEFYWFGNLKLVCVGEDARMKDWHWEFESVE